MFFDGQKALLMVKERDSALKNRVKDYLHHHCNLGTEWVSGEEALFKKLGNSRNPKDYEMIILDDRQEGYSTSLQVLKRIKQRCFNTSVLYLSTLLEIIEPDPDKNIGNNKAADYGNPLYIARQTTRRIDTLNTLFNLVNSQPQLEAEVIHRQVCKGMVEKFDVNSAMVVLFKLHEDTKYKGIVLSYYRSSPLDSSGSSALSHCHEVDLNEMSYIEQLVEYFKPVHIPDLSEDPVFMLELREIFGFISRSVLMVPLVFKERAIGFYAMFTSNRRRKFSLVDVDITMRLAEFAAVSIMSIGEFDYLRIQTNGLPNRLNIRYVPGFGVSA